MNATCFATESYTPILVKKPSPEYPISSLFNQSSGIVEVMYMVNDQGNTFDPLITTTTHPLLLENALKNISKIRYEEFPKEQKGQSFGIKDTIYFQYPKLITTKLLKPTKRQKKIQNLLNKDDSSAKRIRRELNRAVKNQDGYQLDSGGITGTGMALQQLLEFEFELRFGSKENQIRALENGAAFLGWVRQEFESLSDRETAVFTDIFSKLLVLYVQERKYSNALKSYNNLKAIGAETINFDPTIEKLTSFKNDKVTLQSNIVLNDLGDYIFTPLKPSVTISASTGTVDKITLRCERHYLIIDQSADISAFDLNPNWGECIIEINGHPDSQIKIIES